MKFARSLAAAAVALAMTAPMAGAQTTDIAALLAQITALQAQLNALQAPATSTTAYTFTKDLSLGMTDPAVKELQKLLNANGYAVATTGAGSKGMETSTFGPATKAALVKLQMAKSITPASGYFGPKTRAAVNAMVTPATPKTDAPKTDTTTSAPMSVALSADNAAAANVQRGSANNAVLKLTLTGSQTDAVNVTGLVLKSYGTTEATGTTDISAVKLYDENGIQLGSNRTPAGNQVNFVIVPALTIAKGSSRTITVTADIGASATVMSQVRYGIESASAIMGGTSFTGTYPIVGNSFTVVPAGQLGSVSVSKFSTVTKTSVKTGEKDIILTRINVSAGSNEDAAVNQVVFSNSGTISGSDISNLRLRKVGDTTTLATGSLSNNKVTFNLANPISLTKGASVNLELVADIAGDSNSNSRTIIMSVATGGAVARGATSGTNIVSTGSSTGDTITIGLETLTVSMASSHPQGGDALMIKTTNKKDLAKFDVRANGGDIILNTIKVNFNGAADLDGTNYLSSVGLYDGDALVSDLKTVNAETDQSFSLNWTIPANTTKSLIVKGITNTLTNATVTLTTTWSEYSGFGLSSGATITSTSDITTTGITVYQSGLATPSADTNEGKTPYNQAILAPANNVTLAALKVYAQREDMKLTNLKVTVTGTNYDDEADISSLTIYADDGVTALSNPVNYDDAANDTTDTFTFNSSNDFTRGDIIFKKGEYKTLLIKGNASSSLDGTTGLTLSLANAADQLKFIGQDSGTTYDVDTDINGLAFALSNPSRGTYSSDTKVVYIAKSASSPSGSVNNATLTSTGIWDVYNYDSTNATADITGVTFTSKTGLPSGIVLTNDDNDEKLFHLYDGSNNTDLTGADTAKIDLDTGKVTFSGFTLTVNPGEPKQLILKVDAESTAKFPDGQSLQWSIESVNDVTVTNGAVGYANGKWTIPATANTVTF